MREGAANIFKARIFFSRLQPRSGQHRFVFISRSLGKFNQIALSSTRVLPPFLFAAHREGRRVGGKRGSCRGKAVFYRNA
jgi:hypothetical protein